MKIKHYQTVQPIDVGDFDQVVDGLPVCHLMSEVDGIPNSAMWIFQIFPGACTAYHSHLWEHEAFVIGGSGMCRGHEIQIPFRQGDVIYIAPNEPHQFVNTGAVPVELVCVIPKPMLTAYYLARAGRHNQSLVNS